MSGSANTVDRALDAIKILDDAVRIARQAADALRLDLAVRQYDGGQLAYEVPEAARVMGIGERTLWRMVADGEIDSIKCGRSRRVTRADIEAFLKAKAGPLTHPPSGPTSPGPPGPRDAEG